MFVDSCVEADEVELRIGRLERSFAASPIRFVSSELRNASGFEGVPSTQAGPV